MGCWQMFNSWHPKGQRGLICSICQFPSCKYSHHDRLQATSVMSLNMEMKQEVHHQISEAGPSQFQHGNRGGQRALKTVPLSYEDPIPTPLLLILQSLPITSQRLVQLSFPKPHLWDLLRGMKGHLFYHNHTKEQNVGGTAGKSALSGEVEGFHT